MWFDLPEGEAGDSLITNVKSIRNNQAYRKLLDMRHACMYGNIQLAGWDSSGLMGRGSMFNDRLSLNVVKSMVDSVTSEIAAIATPKPTFLTEGGNYEMQQQAKNLENAVGGAFYEGDANKALIRSFSHAGVFGTGPVKIYPDFENKRVAYENVLPWELVTDDGESIYASPRSMYQRRYVDRKRLQSLFAKEDEVLWSKIQVCAIDNEDVEFAYMTTADQVLVTEGWHLPSSVDAGDGRHILAVDGATLLDEKWTREGFPFALMRWSDPIVGFWGTGLAEELMGIQLEINKLLRQIQRGQHLIAGHYLVAAGSNVTTQHINNDLAAIVKYSGAPPQYIAPSIISPEIYQHLATLIQRAYEVAGVSQLSATGQKPAGLNSGAAQREYQDIQSKRFAEKIRRYERHVLNVAEQTVDCAKELAAKGKYEVRGVSKKSIEFLDWSEVNLAKTSYVIELFPTSAIPSTPAGKMEWAEDMIKVTQIPPEDIMDIMDFPDTEEYSKMANADRNVIKRNISEMLKTGEVVRPEPYDNHMLAMRLTRQAYHNARLDGVPEEKLQLLRDYMDATEAHMNPEPPPPDPNAMPPAMPPQPMMDAGMPMGGPPMDPNMMPPDAMPPMAPPMPQ